MTSIISNEYRIARAALREEPAIIAMANDIAKAVVSGQHALEKFQHEDGTPRFEFMMAVNAEYKARTADKPNAAQGYGMGDASHAVLDLVEAILSDPNARPEA